MLVGNVVEKLDIPHEPGEWVEVRKLNHKTLARAAALRSEAGIASMKSVGAELLAVIRQAKDDIQGALKAQAVSADTYDRDIVLQGGVVRWSYAAQVTKESLDDLEEATAKWMAHEIVTRSVAAPSPETVGNVTPPSTGS